ncbi:hypothetical protein FQR65_LT03982 [Abscondita terminalis]|nr:hypothetical protein FQR65_LT03982 [Abscondita terminalis]
MKFSYEFSCLITVLFIFINLDSSHSCNIPIILRGSWFSWENGRNTITELDATSMSRKGQCLDIKEEYHVNYTLIFKQDRCYSCVKFLVRTVNVLEKIETPCVDVRDDQVSIENICRTLNPDQQQITLFSENYVPVNCRSSLEGVWNFAYQNRFKFTGECKHPDAHIRSCQTAGSQFLITNQKFNITYKKCPGMTGTFDGVVEYNCLGDWFVDKNHYLPWLTQKNLVKMRIKSEVVEAGCRLPQNFSGDWINTANIDADIFINETHIIETWYPDEGRYRRTIYVCREQRDSRVMMARLTVDGCQKDYVCFDFVPQHHNVIRFRKGIAVITDNFHTVCSWVQFPNQVKWKYDLYLRKNPVPIRCPVAGKFNFTQKGDILFETRILGGVTLSPRPNIYCKENISDFSVCDTDQKEIAIDETYCLSVDHRGRPVDIYSDPDYRMQCIAYWKENIKSYLITYDELDPFSKYRCWVYQRADLNRVLMSQAIGPFCDLKQDVYSLNYTEGAAVHIEMVEYERERDQCPMHFDDGTNPWLANENIIKVFTFGSYQSGSSTMTLNNFVIILFSLYSLR